GVGIEAGGIKVLAGKGHHAQAPFSKLLIIAEVLLTRGFHRRRVPFSAKTRGCPRQQLIWRALDEAANDLAPSLIRHAMEGGHELVARVEWQRRHPRGLLARPHHVHAALPR